MSAASIYFCHKSPPNQIWRLFIYTRNQCNFLHSLWPNMVYIKKYINILLGIFTEIDVTLFIIGAIILVITA
jgi:hypothetical protein